MVLQYISNLTIPLLLFYVLGYGLFCKVDIFDAFVEGAKDGFKVVAGVLPTLIGLMIAIGLLRASGLMEWIASLVAPWTELVDLPSDLLPLSLIKMISSSAATGLLLDIYKEFGTDSREGYMASLFMCCSETIFYTISVYFMATGDKEHKPVTGMRWTLVGALLATVAGMAASIWLTNQMLS
ncbi:MAG: spore maturation protein [Lachnospiraceae bacterium]|nr:spore maturation protein [Lachnospiraceae bacterium]